MNLGNFPLILLMLLIFTLVGMVPAWPHSRGWGYGPTGFVGSVAVVALVLFVIVSL